MVGTPDAPELRAVFENARAQLYAGQTPIAEALLRGLLSKVEEQPAPAVVIAEAKELLADFLFVGHGRAEEGLALVLSASRYRREQFTTEPLPLIRNMLLAVRYELALAAFSAAVKLAEVARNHAERLLGAHELTVRANLLLAVALRDRARNMIGMTDRDADLNVAFRAAQRACELAQRLHGASSLEVAQAYETFAQILADLDRVERAKLSLGIALRIYERLYADAGLAQERFAAYIGIGTIWSGIDRSDALCRKRAIELLDRGIEGLRGGISPGHLQSLTAALISLGALKLEDDDRVGALEALSMGVLLEELRVNTSASVRSVADTIATYDDLGEVIDRILRAARGGGDGWSGLALATVLSFRSRAIDASARAAALIQRWVGSDWTTGLALRRAVVAAHVARFPRDDLGRKEEELATATELLRTRKAALDAQVLGNAGAALLTRLNGKEVADALEKRLEEHEALVIFVSFNGSAIHLPKRLITSPWSHGFGVAYSAIVVRRSRTALIDLDDDAIALGAANLRQAIEAEADAYGTPDPATQSSRLDPPLRALYDCLWRPIEGCLTGVRRVWIAADGPAALVPFDALIVDDDHLIDRLELLRLVSGRELLPPLEVPSWEQPNDVVVFGAPDFGEPGPVPSADSSPLSVRLANLAPLPGGEREAAIIRKVFPNARLHVGADATEEALLALDSPRILHIATHALAVDDEETSSDSYLDARSDPFYRTVLACAGASKLAFSVPDFTDGLVSAAEFAHIDLVHTPLVVLSGCETGTGELRAGGLVQGFRDAALMAGAQCVVSSLWNVADAPTASLMATFYEALAKGASPAAALRSSMLRLRATDPSPLFWAGFVATGRSWEPVIARDNGG